MPQTPVNINLVHLTQNFPEDGVIVASSIKITSPVDDSILTHTVRFTLNKFPPVNQELANCSIAVILKSSEERNKKILGTADNAYFFGHYLTLNQEDVILIPKESIHQGKPAGKAMVISYEGSLQEAWTKYAEENISLEQLPPSFQAFTDNPAVTESYSASFLSQFNEIISGGRAFANTCEREEAFFEYMKAIETNFASLFLNGEKGFNAWKTYIDSLFYHLILSPLSCEEKLFETCVLNTAYQNLLRRDLGLPLISFKEIMSTNMSKATRDYLKEVIAIWQDLRNKEKERIEELCNESFAEELPKTSLASFIPSSNTTPDKLQPRNSPQLANDDQDSLGKWSNHVATTRTILNASYCTPGK